MYKALYRTWRPLSFDDVISQQHITTTLKNQVINDKTAHAYLFTGSRGTGKTTCARILAKVVNCPNTQNGNPCLTCDICKGADDNTLVDIVEIDAASNNGVDDIRDLRDGTVYTPEHCRFKVYIIDEVHMLSPSAFNALLKIMEEPPDYVKFILATTEIHKVPATITSRCQRYDFRRILSEDIAKRLMYIASKEDIKLSEEAGFLIAKLADGGMRDALSLLDQCSVCEDEITPEIVSNIAGIAGRDYLFDIVGSVIDKDIPKAISVVDNLYKLSKDLLQLCDELIMQFRNMMLIKISPESVSDIISCMPDELAKLQSLSQKIEMDNVLEKISILQNSREKMARVINKRVEFEMAIIQLCRGISAPSQVDNSDVLDKIKQLENKMKNSSITVDDSIKTPIKSPVIEPVPNVDLKKIDINSLPEFEQWDKILEEFEKVNPSVAGSLVGSTAKVTGNLLLITAVNRFFIILFKIKENAQSLGDVIFKVTNQRFAIRARCLTTSDEQRNLAQEMIKKALDSNIDTAVE